LYLSTINSPDFKALALISSLIEPPYIQKGKQWDNVLPAITFAINVSVNSSTKYSPFEVVFGFRPKCPLHQHHTDFSTIPADYHDYVGQ
jgi:hypothetical protein